MVRSLPHYFRKKKASKIATFLSLFIPDDFWLTLGNTTYYPNSIDNPNSDLYEDTRDHEYIHVLQWDTYKFMFPILYALIPLPIFFAYFRWRFERQAYLINILHHDYQIDNVVNSLGSKGYFWTWPKSWMRKWFEQQVKEK